MTNTVLGKHKLADTIAEEFTLPRHTALGIVGTLLEEIVETLRRGGTVRLPNLGSLVAVPTPERRYKGRGGPGVAPAGTRVRFRLSSLLKAELNK